MKKLGDFIFKHIGCFYVFLYLLLSILAIIAISNFLQTVSRFPPPGG